MFLAYFRSDIDLNNKLFRQDDIIINRNKNYYILIGKNKNKIIKLRQKLLRQKLVNQYDNLIDDSIFISPVNIQINNAKFNIAYNKAKQLFIKELLDNLDKEKYINFYNNDIIYLPNTITCPTKLNSITRQKCKIKFRKIVFLQDWKFINELNEILKKKNKKITFQKITKFIWEKKIIFLENSNFHQDQNK